MEQQTPTTDGNDSDAVPPGYKRTEVGVIPEDWEVRLFSEHFRIYAGGDVPGHSLSQTQNASHPYPVFANALQNHGLYGFTNECRSREDSLTITARGFLGHAEYRDEPFFPIVRLLVLEPIGQLDARFTTYAVNDRVKFAFESTGVPQLTAPQVGKYSIASPHPPEQRAIAEALSDVDGLLGALEALIAKKRVIKQAAMQQLLTGKTRLPGFSGEWEVKRLGEVADIKNGATPSTQVASYWDGTIPWCTPTDITSTPGKYLSKTERCITEAGLASCAASLLPPGSLLLCSRATIGEVRIAETEICTNQGFKSLVCRPGVSNEFLYYKLLTLKPKLVERAIGSTFLEIGKRDIESILTALPGEAEQTAIATVLSDMDAEIAALEARRKKTKAIKRGMMQQLLTGRIRLVEPEETA